MSGDDDIELDYHYLTNRALKHVVRDVLSLTQELGQAPGEHHFYIEFLTTAPGVDIPGHLLDSYPERMTIVLQHQFDDLTVGDEEFAVTLYFKRQPARLVVPYEAVMSFADPSVQFGLRFDAPAPEEAAARTTPAKPAAVPGGEKPTAAPLKPPSDGGKKPDKTAGEMEEEKAGADVVSLDAFRKK